MPRKNTDYQWTEMLSVLLLIININDFIDLSKDKLIDLIKNNKDKIYITSLGKYVDDFMKKKETNINDIYKFSKTVIRFKEEIINKHGEIKKCFVTGKNYNRINDDEFQSIKQINKKLEEENPNDKKKICKSDIYIKFKSNKHIGASIKKDKICTKANYSVQKMLKEIVDIDLSNNLNNIKNRLLQDNYITRQNYKSKRDTYNNIFRQNNAYYNELLKNIENNENEIIKRLLCNMFSCNNKDYDVYELWDIDYKLLKLTKEMKHMKIVVNNEKKSKSKASKLFFKLKYKKIDFIDLEIRFKGNPFNSPQIQTTSCNFEVLSS